MLGGFLRVGGAVAHRSWDGRGWRRLLLLVYLVAVVHSPGVLVTASTPRRAMLTSAASRTKSAAILALPRMRARRPPWRRRISCPILRSTLGRVAR